MADYDTIMKALRNAHAAGDTEAARRLAAMAMAAKAQTAQVAPLPPAPPPVKADDPGHFIGAGGAVGNGFTFGLGDEIGGFLLAAAGRDPEKGTWFDYSEPYDQRYAGRRDMLRREQDGYQEHHPVASAAAEIGGSLVAPGLGAAGVAAKGGGLAARALTGAGTGAALGGVYGFNEGEGGFDQRVQNAKGGAAIGGAIGAVIPAGGSVLQKLIRQKAEGKAIRQAAKGAPTSEELRIAGTGLYQKIDEAGVQIKPEAFDRIKADINDYLNKNTGYDNLPGSNKLTPGSARVMETMDQAAAQMAAEPTAALPFNSLDQIRRRAGGVARNFSNPEDQKAAASVIGKLDDFVQHLGPDDVVAGDARVLQETIPQAREVWARMSRSQKIDDAIENSENYLSGTASGTRAGFQKILKNPKLSAGFTEAEKKAMRTVVNGGPLSQLVNLAGGGIAQIAAVGGGALSGGLAGGLSGAAAAAMARKASEAMTARRAETVRAAIASGKLRDPDFMKNLMSAGEKTRRLSEAGLFGASASQTN